MLQASARRQRSRNAPPTPPAGAYEPLWLRERPWGSVAPAVTLGSPADTADTPANRPSVETPLTGPTVNGSRRPAIGRMMPPETPDDRFVPTSAARRRWTVGRKGQTATKSRPRSVGLAFLVAGIVGLAGLIGLGIAATTSTSDQAPDPTESAASSTVASTSSIPPVAALARASASVRLLAGGPDFLGNGGPASNALLRRPTSVVRVGTALVIADAGSLRLMRADGRIEAVTLDDLPEGMRIDHVAAIGGRDVLLADEATAVMVRVRNIGSDSTTVERVTSGGIVTPVALAGDGSGGALIADPGTGVVWRWTPGAAPVRIVESLLSPSAVVALPGGGALVTDRGSGVVLRVEAGGIATAIVAAEAVARARSEELTIVRATPTAAVVSGAGRVTVLLSDASMASVPLFPTGRGGASIVTEYLRGPTAIVSDADSTLVIEGGERRIVRIDADRSGEVSINSIIGQASWPLLNVEALAARDVVLVDPVGIAATPSGSVVVADRGTNVLWRLDANGDAVRLAGTDTWGNTPDNPNAAKSALASPTDVAVGADGVVYFTEPPLSRIRAIDTDGALRTVAEPQLDRPDQALFSPGPLAIAGANTLVAGDRFVGGLWRIGEESIRPIAGTTGAIGAIGTVGTTASPSAGTRFVFVSRENGGTVVAGDPFGSLTRVDSVGAVIDASSALVPDGAIVRSGVSSATGAVILFTHGGADVRDSTIRSGGFMVERRVTVAGRDAVQIASLARQGSSIYATMTGVRAAAEIVSDARPTVLTSTVLGPGAGRANEIELIDPLGLTALSDGSVLIADRGGARVRLLAGGQLTNMAGSGRIDGQRNAKANAEQVALDDLHDVISTRDGTVVVANGASLLQIDGMGLARDLAVRHGDGRAMSLRSIAQGPDGSIIAVDDLGHLVRVERGDSPESVSSTLLTSPSLATVRVDDRRAIWAVTKDGRLGEVRGDRFVATDLPRDLVAVASDERGGRLVVVGRDGSVVERERGVWRRLAPATALATDRRATEPERSRPTDVVILPDGAVLVSDAGRDAVLVYRTS